MHELFRPELTWIVSPLLTYLGFALALVLLAHLDGQQRSPSSTIAWLLVILLMPYIGVPLYLMFGGRKMRRMARRKQRVYGQSSIDASRKPLGGNAEKLLNSFGIPPATAGNREVLVATGEEAYWRLSRTIDEAASSIDITTYILGTDEVAHELIVRLARRAAEGVKVRLLLDSFGSWRVKRRFLAPLTDAGARVAFFMPVLHIPFRGRANLRNHRKIIVVDNGVAMIGGMNLAGEYMGPDPRPETLARPLARHHWPGRPRPGRRCSGRTGDSPPARTSARSRLPPFAAPTRRTAAVPPRSWPAVPTSRATRFTRRCCRRYLQRRGGSGS